MPPVFDFEALLTNLSNCFTNSVADFAAVLVSRVHALLGTFLLSFLYYLNRCDRQRCKSSFEGNSHITPKLLFVSECRNMGLMMV